MNGKDKDGNQVAAGEYKIKAEGNMAGQFTSLPVATFKNIDSVNINGSSGIIVNTSIGAVKLTDIAEISG